MRIWFISDTHGGHDQLVVPDADMVIHCGDESNARNLSANYAEAVPFFQWYRNVPIRHKIYVPGNHSIAVWNHMVHPEDYPEIDFLIHQSITIEGLSIFGSPFTPRFGDWAFMQKRNVMDSVWRTITGKVDILVTHGPPKGVLDLTTDIGDNRPVQVGCKSLLNAVNRIKPKYHAFGHIHDEDTFLNYGMLDRGETKFINCACMNLKYEIVHNGFLVDTEGVL